MKMHGMIYLKIIVKQAFVLGLQIWALCKMDMQGPEAQEMDYVRPLVGALAAIKK